MTNIYYDFYGLDPLLHVEPGFLTSPFSKLGGFRFISSNDASINPKLLNSPAVFFGKFGFEASHFLYAACNSVTLLSYTRNAN
jgi:hypothetical protein